MLHGFGFFAVIVMGGWIGGAILVLSLAFAGYARLRARPHLGKYGDATLLIIAVQAIWALTALLSTETYAIGGLACLSGAVGLLVLPFASALDILTLIVVGRRRALNGRSFVYLVASTAIFGVVAGLTVIRSALLCTV